MQPLWVDDAAEASDECGRLLLDLGVHAEVGHQVDVADPEIHQQKKAKKINSAF